MTPAPAGPLFAYQQRISDLQAALRALWPDRPKVYFQEGQGDDAPVLTAEERAQLFRVADAINQTRHEGDRG